MKDSAKETVKKFIQNISEITELDYGDFMRKANHYLMELQENIQTPTDQTTQYILNDMKQHLQFNPNWDIESTRHFILNEAQLINQQT
ncbi:MAG: hypothetical protein A2622_14020 [Bdellovibrionales bacterium RIFCSPHIGHO2_01_FULL_40_29]|nr:MAG: hypothetical protein A2622_14020 [Bdellovibrionales bacterium RIFCSPHIGHO2_01_FULL_40_29]OFZ33637.1 MAG: hypothetical protein A3D17_11630 [Bdellovibrionales bacterium RIFCSPHIGHO2_02_FULL_40_15]